MFCFSVEELSQKVDTLVEIQKVSQQASLKSGNQTCRIAQSDSGRLLFIFIQLIILLVPGQQPRVAPDREESPLHGGQDRLN